MRNNILSHSSSVFNLFEALFGIRLGFGVRTHNKMDHAKIASPMFSHKSKELDSLVKLPMSVIGMIAHGHGDVCYAHYGLDIFPHD